MTNTALLYYKNYYRSDDGGYVWNWPQESDADKKALKHFFAGQLRALNESVAAHYKELLPLLGLPKTEKLYHFTLQIQYPGLLFGTGTLHETATPGEHKLGLQMDGVTGLPVLPGSSVKGLLRAAFPQYGRRIGGEVPGFQQEKRGHILELLGLTEEGAAEKAGAYLESCGVQETAAARPHFVHLLEQRVFEGKAPALTGNGGWGFVPLPMYGRDVFLEGLPVPGENLEFFAEDAITHHPGEYGEPNPVMLLKIAGGHYLHFQFLLENDGLLTAREKLNLFEGIVRALGVGAKTNTGYGCLRRAEQKNVGWLHGGLEERKQIYLTREEAEAMRPAGALQKGMKLGAQVIGAAKEGRYNVNVLLNKGEKILPVKSAGRLEEGKWIVVVVKGITKGEVMSVGVV